jgi:hypothetical protein
MTKKDCPLGEDCDLTLAWMMGAEDARDKTKARIAVLTEQLESAQLDAKEAEAYSVWLEGRLAKAVEALKRIQGQPGYRLPSPQDIASATLAEIEGDKP